MTLPINNKMTLPINNKVTADVLADDVVMQVEHETTEHVGRDFED